MTTEETSTKRVRCTSSESSEAAEIVVSNVDLLTEILLHVPAKPLLRFRCVSKYWFFLISDPQFARNHARRNPSLISGLYLTNCRAMTKPFASVSLDDTTNLPTLDFADGVEAGSTTVTVHSCKGLMLCSNVERTYYAVCNLTTQKYKLLPKPGFIIGSYCPYCAYLAFDPSKSPHYKVVLVRRRYEIDDRIGPFYLIGIYSSESECWKRLLVSAPPNAPLTLSHGAFWNGSIHWMTYVSIQIRFEVDAEKLTATPIPKKPGLRNGYMVLYFGECGGHLLLIQSRCDTRFIVLEMEGDHCGWTVKCRVNLIPIFKSLSPEVLYYEFSVLCVVNGAKGEDFAVVLSIPNHVISFNLKGKTWKVLRKYLKRNGCFRAEGHQFIESLSPV